MRHVATLFFGVLLALPEAAFAADTPQSREVHGTPAGADADLFLQADIHIDSLRVISPGNLQISVPGSRARRAGYSIQRYNLPQRLQPGRVYRNVRFVLTISSQFLQPRQASAIFDHVVEDGLSGRR